MPGATVHLTDDERMLVIALDTRDVDHRLVAHELTVVLTIEQAELLRAQLHGALERSTDSPCQNGLLGDDDEDPEACAMCGEPLTSHAHPYREWQVWQALQTLR